jgi:hypothetical protein
MIVSGMTVLFSRLFVLVVVMMVVSTRLHLYHLVSGALAVMVIVLAALMIVAFLSVGMCFAAVLLSALTG